MGAQCSSMYDKISDRFPQIDNTKQVNENIAVKKLPGQKGLELDCELQQKSQKIIKASKQLISKDSNQIISFHKQPDCRYNVKFVDQSQYKGCINQLGMRDCQGQQIWKDGLRYIGQWRDNLPNGQGLLVSVLNQFTFRGNWVDGKAEGKGEYYGQKGLYQGNWSKNKQHGLGRQTWKDGSKFQGHYLYGNKHGHGIYKWPDHSSYKGNWHQGKIQGKGTYKYQDGRTYQGTFVNNKMHGQGTYKWPDGRKYKGQYKNDKKQGYGRYYWTDGKYYEGQWKDGKRSGYGKVVHKNGIIKYSIWLNDQLVQQSIQVAKQVEPRSQYSLSNILPDSYQNEQLSPTFKIQKPLYVHKQRQSRFWSKNPGYSQVNSKNLAKTHNRSSSQKTQSLHRSNFNTNMVQLSLYGMDLPNQSKLNETDTLNKGVIDGKDQDNPSYYNKKRTHINNQPKYADMMMKKLGIQPLKQRNTEKKNKKKRFSLNKTQNKINHNRDKTDLGKFSNKKIRRCEVSR